MLGMVKRDGASPRNAEGMRTRVETTCEREVGRLLESDCRAGGSAHQRGHDEAGEAGSPA
jgi:hypothetical protein